MILNMHIRTDYRTWGVEKKAKRRVTTLCHKITSPKYAGIPGINSEQATFVSDGDYGWCLECCAEFIKETYTMIHAIDNELLASLYNNARAITAHQLMIASQPTSQN
jgi:hypothetical protein